MLVLKKFSWNLIHKIHANWLSVDVSSENNEKQRILLTTTKRNKIQNQTFPKIAEKC